MPGIGVIFLNLLLMISCIMGMYLSNNIVKFAFSAVFSLEYNQSINRKLKHLKTILLTITNSIIRMITYIKTIFKNYIMVYCSVQ